MTGYVHHVSGRLRVKLQKIKGNSSRAEQLTKVIRQIGGVIYAETNTVTGSVLIRYDVSRVEMDTFLNSLQLALMQSGAANTSSIQLKTPYSPAASAFTGRLADVIMEKIIERSAVAIVGALL